MADVRCGANQSDSGRSRGAEIVDGLVTDIVCCGRQAFAMKAYNAFKAQKHERNIMERVNNRVPTHSTSVLYLFLVAILVGPPDDAGFYFPIIIWETNCDGRIVPIC